MQKSKAKIEGFIDKRADKIDKSIFYEGVKILTITEATAHGWQEKTVIISPVVCDDIVCELHNRGVHDIICLTDIIEPCFIPITDEEGGLLQCTSI